MTEKKSNRPQFTHKNPFHGILSPNSRHTSSPVINSTLLESLSLSPKKRKIKANKQRGGRKDDWSPGHYLPTSCILSPNNITPNSSPPPLARRRWSSKLACEKQESMLTMNNPNDCSSLKYHARKVFHRLFSNHKKSTSSPGYLYHLKSKNPSQDALDTPKPTISYPMKLHNTDNGFVTTQDPWEASARSSSLRRRATLGTRNSQKCPTSRADRRFSSCQPSITSRRLSFNVHHRMSQELTHNHAPSTGRTTEISSTHRTSDRPRSANQFKLSLDSRRSENHSFPPNRGSLYRHPPTRPLSLSRHGRRSSSLGLGEEVSKRINIDRAHDVGSRRSSMVSSNLTSTTNQNRQSWTTGRVILENSTSHGSALLGSERSSLLTSGTDQKSVSSYRLPAANTWADVIEEDITLTLMGSPDSTRDIGNGFAPETPVTIVPPTTLTSSKPTPVITSSAVYPEGPAPILPRLRSSPTVPSVRTSTPSSTPSLRPLSIGVFHRPLSLLFKTNSTSLIDETDSHENPRSDWYSEIMNSVEQTISQIN